MTVKPKVAQNSFVIVESPFAGHGMFWLFRLFDKWENIRYARKCLRDSLLRGEIPIASHLLYTQPGVLDDNNDVERAIGIEAGLAWHPVVSKTVVYIDRGVSSGMRYGIDRAKSVGTPVEYRKLSFGDR